MVLGSIDAREGGEGLDWSWLAGWLAGSQQAPRLAELAACEGRGLDWLGEQRGETRRDEERTEKQKLTETMDRSTARLVEARGLQRERGAVGDNCCRQHAVDHRW